MTRKVIKKEITCPRCGGTGRVFNTAECVFTFGIAFILGAIDHRLKDVCPKCGGDGVVYRETIIEE